MSQARALPPAPLLASYQEKILVISRHIREQAARVGALRILEAGCGTRWDIDLRGVQYQLIGIDADREALDLRMRQQHDLHTAILADLRVAELEPEAYDVIFNSDVLEHVAGAEGVLSNFVRWLKPGGIMILGFPNGDSAYSFFTRVLPFPFHVFFKRYIQGIKDAGQPGREPYPTVFDPVVSRSGLHAFIRQHALIIRAEYRLDGRPRGSQLFWKLARLPIWLIHLASLGRLSLDHRALLFVIEKPTSRGVV